MVRVGVLGAGGRMGQALIAAIAADPATVLGGAAVNTGTIPSKALREAILEELRSQHELSRTALDLRMREVLKQTGRVAEAVTDSDGEQAARRLDGPSGFAPHHYDGRDAAQN